MFLLCGPVQATSEIKQPTKNILFVFSWNRDVPWQKEIEKGFESQFTGGGEAPNFFYEYIDAGRFTSAQQRAIFSEYLAKKYASIRLDDVVLESEPAAALFQSNPGLFGEAKILALNPSPKFKLAHKLAVRVPVSMDYKASIKEILTLSKAKIIYLVGGSTMSTEKRIRAISQILASDYPRLRVVSLVGLPMPEILSRVESAPPDSAILYALVFQDGTGKGFLPYAVAQQLSQRAGAPVYSFWTSLMGSGIVGGYLLSGERVGREAAILLSNPVRDTLNVNLSARFHGYYFDWRQLQRWNIPESSLPANSVIMFKRPNFFREHMAEFVGVFILFGITVFLFRYRELKRYNREIDNARVDLMTANQELGRVKSVLEQKNKMLRVISVTDRLTSLHNRAYMEDRLQYELNRINRHPVDLCAIMVDIDHFKRINDQYGHPVGDEMLIIISEVLRKNIRSTDEIGRWGGEEFLVICPGTGMEEGVKLANKLLSLVGTIQHKKVGLVTCSFGVATAVPGMSRQDLVKNADEALYDSKAAGRNCVSSVLPVASSGSY